MGLTPFNESRLKCIETVASENTCEINEPAQTLFKSSQAYEMTLTDLLFETVSYEGEASGQSSEQFKRDLLHEHEEYSFPSLYNGYYDEYSPKPIMPEELNSNTKPELAEMYSLEHENLTYERTGLESDLDLLKAISEKNSEIKTFDYEGRKYRRKDSHKLIPEVKLKLDNVEKQLRQNDLNIYRYFRSLAAETNNETTLDRYYAEFFRSIQHLEEGEGIIDQIRDHMQFTEKTNSYRTINKKLDELEPIETKLKALTNGVLKNDKYFELIDSQIMASIRHYVEVPMKYFSGSVYFDENLHKLGEVLMCIPHLLSTNIYSKKKELLDYQAHLTRDKTD